MTISEALLALMGFALGDAAYFSSLNEPGELFAPFAIVEINAEHEYIGFESETQQEAIDSAVEYLNNYKEAQAWVLVHDGLFSDESYSRVDALIVTGWQQEIGGEIMVVLPYQPVTNTEQFKILDDPILLLDGQVGSFNSNLPMEALMRGIQSNERSSTKWKTWCANDA